MTMRASTALTHPLTRAYTISTRLRRSVTTRHLAQKFRSRERGREGGRGWIVEMGLMDTHEGPIWRLTRSLEIRCRAGGSNKTMSRVAAGGLEVGGFESLFALACSCHESKDRSRADAVLGALLRLAGDDELAIMAVLVALRPWLGPVPATGRRGDRPRGGSRRRGCYGL